MNNNYTKFNHNPFETHKIVFELISYGENILDIGCASGYFAKELQQKDCKVWGIERDHKAIETANKYCKKVFKIDLEKQFNLVNYFHFFDTVLILDVIEHLKNPEVLLSKVKNYITKNGKIIISTPNIAHLSIRINLLRGRFNYEQQGILDRTHIHFYTYENLKSLLKKCNLQVQNTYYANGLTKTPIISKITDRLSFNSQHKIVTYFPKLFAYQFIVLVK